MKLVRFAFVAAMVKVGVKGWIFVGRQINTDRMRVTRYDPHFLTCTHTAKITSLRLKFIFYICGARRHNIFALSKNLRNV